MTTPRIALPELVEGQSQGEVTHNEALAILDSLCQPSVKSRATTAQPGSPSNGDTYILPASPTGAQWSGQGNKIAYYKNGWRFLTPAEGWTFWVQDEDVIVTHTGSGFSSSVNFIVPSQTGNSGKVLGTNGTAVSWVAQSGAGSGWTVRSINSNTTYSDTSGRYLILVDATSSGVIVTLPAASGNTAEYIVRRVAGSNTIDVVRSGSDTVDGGTTAQVFNSVASGSRWFVSTGTNAWWSTGN